MIGKAVTNVSEAEMSAAHFTWPARSLDPRPQPSAPSWPDEGNGVVILSQEDNLAKMKLILEDKTKFKKSGEVDEHDRTLLQKRAQQAYLLRANKEKRFTKEVYNRVRPVGRRDYAFTACRKSTRMAALSDGSFQ